MPHLFTPDYYPAGILSPGGNCENRANALWAGVFDFYPGVYPVADGRMQTPDYQWSTSGGAYRYGFNSQEKDDEIYGTGNSYTAEYWQYDARLGRRWNVDPVDQVSVSNYACFGNNPVFFVDPFGAEIIPTDEAAEEGFDSYIKTFDTENTSGESLFGIVKKTEYGVSVYSSSLKISSDKFSKRAESAGLSEDKITEALSLYNTLQKYEVFAIRSIKDEETRDNFTNKGFRIYKNYSQAQFLFPSKSSAIHEAPYSGKIADTKHFPNIEGEFGGPNWLDITNTSVKYFVSKANMHLYVINADNICSFNNGISRSIKAFAIDYPVYKSIKAEIQTRKKQRKLYKNELE